MHRISIIGYGVVGQSIHRLFGDEIVAVKDPKFKEGFAKDEAMGMTQSNLDNSDLIVICVPTNEKEDGSADTSIVWESLQYIANNTKNFPVTLIKSTVPPSEIKKMFLAYPRLVFSPEFIGESKYFTPPWKYPDPRNMESHTWQVFGGEKKDTSTCVDIFKRKMGVDTQFFQTDIITASLAKYMENSFFALKVTFCNEWFDIAKTFGVDYNELRELWLLDPRINRNHTLVFPKDRGYGGRCFPKDIKAIVTDSMKAGYTPGLMMTTSNINNNFRKENDKK